jgi:hypothetical protein
MGYYDILLIYIVFFLIKKREISRVKLIIISNLTVILKNILQLKGHKKKNTRKIYSISLFIFQGKKYLHNIKKMLRKTLNIHFFWKLDMLGCINFEIWL